MSRPRRALWTIPILLLAIGLPATAQTPSSDWISEIDVRGLTPFEASFRLRNDTTSSIRGINGQAVLSDQFGQAIEALPITTFSVDPGTSPTVSVSSRWDFQQTGIYLLEIVLDLGNGRLISNALAFRILPIQLPLAAPVSAFGEGLRTLYQQPVNWGLSRIDAEDAWTVTHGVSDVVIAVIDSGIDGSIPQLAGALWVNPGEIPDNGLDDDGNGYVDDVHGWDFRDGDNSSLSGSAIHWHGTFVAGILAAQPGELPIVGVAPGARLMDVRFLDAQNEFSSRDWNLFADAVDYAVANGADIINLSIYANGHPPSVLERAIQRAAKAGIVIVGISGNTHESGVLYPGKYDDVLAVAATTEDDMRADFSAWGPEVALSAPGEGITSFLPGGRTATRSGTSFAAPHVSGTLALILSSHRSLSAAQAIDLLMNNVVDLGPRGADESFGLGLINAWAAVR